MSESNRPQPSPANPVKPLRNWAGNIRFRRDEIFQAASIEAVQSFIRSHNKVRVLGTRHSFNRIADGEGAFLSLLPMNNVASADPDTGSVTVEGGATYAQACPRFARNGRGLHNLASLPHISIAGACSTATHGSGERNGNLATAVSAIEIVLASGELIALSRKSHGDAFLGAVVGLGALGAVVRLTLDTLPAFTMRQYVYQDLPQQAVTEHFDDIQSAGYSVSLFTDWRNERVRQVWIKTRADATRQCDGIKEFFGARAALQNLHPIGELSAENCTDQMGQAGPWYDRLPHFRSGFMPSAGDELQSEYFVHRRNAVDAILAVTRLSDEIAPHLLISEIRTIAEDDLWMSPCYRRPSVAIHFTWKPDWPAVRQLLPVIERELSPFSPRPHWGKLFTLPPSQLQASYEKQSDFVKLAQHYDQLGKFRNRFLEDYLFATGD